MYITWIHSYVLSKSAVKRSIAIHRFNFLVFADDLKIYRVVKSLEDCIYLQTDVNAAQMWYLENYAQFSLTLLMFLRGK
jgi:hypothetical protein